MSVRIDGNSLSVESLETIKKFLYIQPKEKYFFGSKNRFYSGAGSSVKLYKFFSLDQKTNIVTLPYYFAQILVGRNLNFELFFPPNPFKFLFPLYDYQQPVATEALTSLNKKGTAILNLFTSFGKTTIGCYLASQLGLTTIVIMKESHLLNQWKNEFSTMTNAKVWIVGDQPMPKEPFQIVLCLITRFEKLPSELIPTIGTVIFDEAHELCIEMAIPSLLGVSPRYVIALTATFNRSDGMIVMMQSICGKEVIYRRSTKPFNVFRYNTNISIPLTQRNGKVDWAAHCKFQMESEQRNRLILELIYANLHMKVLVLTWRVAHVQYLEQCLSMAGISVDTMYGSAKSHQDTRVLLGVIKKIGTGYDQKAVCENFGGERINLLILVGSIKSVELLEQVAGRCFRSEFPNIIYLIDDNKISENHWKIGIPWFRSRNGTIYDVSSTPETELRTDPAEESLKLVTEKYLSGQ